MKTSTKKQASEKYAANVEQRELLRMRLEEENEVELAEVLFRCAEPLEMTSQCCGETREIEKGCKKRWCPVCAPKITGLRIEKYSYAAQQMKWPLAVTLTCKNKVEAHGAIREFRRALSKFRRTKFWRGTVKGGLCSLEVTNTGCGWHVHAHVLVDCRWLSLSTPAPRTSDSTAQMKAKLKAAHEELSREWAKTLRQEEAVVWVERAWGKALLETVKYAVKVGDLLNCKDKIGPIIREMHRLQLVNGFGSMYGVGKKFQGALDEAKTVCMCGRCGKESEWIPSTVYSDRVWSKRSKERAVHAAVARESWRRHNADGVPY